MYIPMQVLVSRKHASPARATGQDARSVTRKPDIAQAWTQLLWFVLFTLTLVAIASMAGCNSEDQYASLSLQQDPWSVESVSLDEQILPNVPDKEVQGLVAHINKRVVVPSNDGDAIYEAIKAANASGKPVKIVLPAGTYNVPNYYSYYEDGHILVEVNVPPPINVRVFIKGAGSDKTFVQRSEQDAEDGLENIFRVSPTGILILDGVTVQGGASTYGGAIYNENKLVVRNSVVRGNRAPYGGGIYSAAQTRLDIINSIITENIASEVGGGISSSANRTRIIRSTISYNSGSELGGGIISGGHLVIRDSSVHHNNSDTAGGIHHASKLTMVNSSVIFNKSYSFGAGLYLGARTDRYAPKTLVNSTIAFNILVEGRFCIEFDDICQGGGMFVEPNAVVKLMNTIVAENQAHSGPDCFGALISRGNNLFGDAGVAAGGCQFSAKASDVIGYANLGAFVDNGSPRNGHVPLLMGSPAIDTANPKTCPPRDQLGRLRVDGDLNGSVRCDMGAIEYLPTLAGDLDGDGDVDRADLQIIIEARGTPASGVNDPRDLDHDGRITVLDARKLRLLCTRAYCRV